MNRTFVLGFILIFFFSAPIFSQVNEKVVKEKTKKEHTIIKKINRVNKTQKGIGDNKLNMVKRKSTKVNSQEIPGSPTSITQVATAIPAFIGYTEKGSDVPIQISSMTDYRNNFGGPSNNEIGEFEIDKDGKIAPQNILAAPHYKMYYMLELFFANGGDDCFIISVGHYDEENSIKKEALLAGLDLLDNEDIPTLILFPDATGLNNSEDTADVYKAALAQCAERKDRFLICDVEESDDNIIKSIEDFRFLVGSDNLEFGAVYFPSLETTLNYTYSEEKIKVKLENRSKVMALRHTEESILSDFEKTEESLYHTENGKYRKQYREIKRLINAQNLIMPPSGAVAGVYAKVDDSKGVWKAPANVSINRVSAPKLVIGDDAQANLNVSDTGKSINAIRSFDEKGVMIWGARTLAGNDTNWKYISVRRLGIMIEESIKNALELYSNDLNEASTWNNVKIMIENYLTKLWRSGALNGTKPKEAFFVKVGLGESMIPQDLQDGKMIVQIGISAVKPAEFILLKFSQKMK